jgi:dipeptidyl aminopeptidase/acylaminoacyl peptidase
MKKLAIIIVLLVSCVVIHAQTYTIQQYLNIKAATAPSFSPDAQHMAFLSNATGTSQVWVMKLPGGQPRQLTNYDDNISFVQYSPAGNGLVFGKARGGDENTQIYWMSNDGTQIKNLTDMPTIRHNFGGWSQDGKMIYYASDDRDPNYFDIYTLEFSASRDTDIVESLIYKQDGNNSVEAISDNGKKLIISRSGTELSLDNDLYLFNVETNKTVHLTKHTGAAQFGDAHFVADGIVFAHNDKREFVSLAQMRKINASGDDWSDANRETQILDNTAWDIGGVEMNDYGSIIAYTINSDGFSELYLRKYETGGKPLITTVEKNSEMIKLPEPGIIGGMTFSKDQSKLAFSFNSATSPNNIWLYDLQKKRLTRVITSDTAGIAEISFIRPKLIKYRSFDGREISAWYYEPSRQRSFSLKLNDPKDPGGLKSSKPTMPVIVSIHGGPEGQERPGFNPLYQYYLSRGYAILAPNVRGSTGYGKTFTHLDDVKKREDSVKDIAAAVEWLKTTGGADPRRIAVMGGSYGGYMTLAAITLYPDLWAAAIDTVGISNWESFLKNTSGYRRRQREVEYGRLDKDINFLRSVSPIKKINRIKCPLFVIAGRNDPRVPWTEGQQMVDAIRKRGGVVEWKVYDDEGHGISKLKNRLELYPLVADFLDKNMK